MNDNLIPIVFSTDHNYVMPTAVTVCSLLESAEGTHYDIHILVSENVDQNDRLLLERQVRQTDEKSRVSFVDMSGFFNDGFEIRGISKACYYRLMIPWILPQFDKIVYSDVDVIFKTSLKPLYDTDVSGNFVAGAKPYRENRWQHMKSYFDKIGADYKTYINSGILVINAALQRENDLDKDYKEYSKRKYVYQDQDIINIVCRGRIVHFDNRYNLIPDLYGTTPELSRGVVIHYAGGKPWKEFTYAWMEWWNVYLRSVCADMKFYHEISAKILSHRYQIGLMAKKVRQKFDIMVKNFKA